MIAKNLDSDQIVQHCVGTKGKGSEEKINLFYQLQSRGDNMFGSIRPSVS